MYSRIINKNPDYFDALHLYGLFKYQQGQLNDALKLVGKAVKINPRSANALNSRGVILAHLERHVEALASFDAALNLEPNHVQALSNRCNSLNELGRYHDAITSSDRALAINPNYSDVYIPRGAALLSCKRYTEALESYEQSIKLNPDLAMAWNGRGNVLLELKRYDNAIAAYDRALTLKPDLAEAWFGRGKIFTELKRYDDAFAAYDKAVALKPDLDYAASLRLHAKLQLCDWTNLQAEIAQLLATIRERQSPSVPFTLLAMPSSAADQLQCAKRYVQEQPTFSPVWRGETYSHERIRVAYLSADFREHPVSCLMAGLFEQHDSSRFETTAISFGPDQDSPMRRRIKAAFEHFIDVEAKNDGEISELIRRLEIDILVDLMGFTQHNRFNVLARRPAPIQVNYLGYLGTMGAEFIDYVIADKIALPSDQQKYYTENIVHLPDCFLVNDDRLAIVPHTPSRRDVGLPSEGFIFCSFNASYKIARPMFELWMRLLQAVEGSVLWLLESNAEMVANLRGEALRCGVDHGRIIFASRIALSEHLARQRLSGLFLDTTPYNAGATAAAALWSGVPVLTVLGETLVGRMAASMLQAICLPELITTTLEDYERMAIDLATHPERLSSIKRRLAENRLTTPLFDTKLFTKHIETSYAAMYDRHQAGLMPDHLYIPD